MPRSSKYRKNELENEQKNQHAWIHAYRLKINQETYENQQLKRKVKVHMELWSIKY